MRPRHRPLLLPEHLLSPNNLKLEMRPHRHNRLLWIKHLVVELQFRRRDRLNS
jgi:hypothetical protein